MTRPNLLPDGYRVTLECGHTMGLSDHRPRVGSLAGCWSCDRMVPVLDVVPAYTEPPALRSRWVRVLSRVPGLSRLVDAISGPWTGGDE